MRGLDKGETENDRKKVDSPDKNNGELSAAQMRAQALLPKSEWSPVFRNYVDKLIERKRLREQQDESRTAEQEREETYQRYMSGLGLKEEMLRNKRVLDLGSGEGNFVAACIERGVTQDIYGIDAHPDIVQINQKYVDHFYIGDFRNTLPAGEADYVVSVGAVSLGIDAENGVEVTKDVLRNAIAATRFDGEVRIFPVSEPSAANPYEHARTMRLRWDEIAKDLTAEGIEARIEPVSVFVTGKDNSEVFLISVLILRHTKEVSMDRA